MAFGIALAIAGAMTPFVILALRLRALKVRITADRAVTAAERQALRGRGRVSVTAFIAFWVLAIGTVASIEVTPAAQTTRWIAYGAIVAAAFAIVFWHLQTRCPICRYRLGYQRSLGVPSRCERCGADL